MRKGFTGKRNLDIISGYLKEKDRFSMLFSSSVFLFVFLPAVLLGYYLLRGQKARNLFLLAASLLFS